MKKILIALIAVVICSCTRRNESPAVKIAYPRVKFERLASEGFFDDQFMRGTSFYIMTVDDTASFLIAGNNAGMVISPYNK